jgi:TolA-binding protein
MVAACLAALSPFTLPVALRAQETNPAAANYPQPADLARTAFAENMPQVSAAVLRTQIQQEQDPVRRLELSRRLVALLAAGGRNDEILAVCASSGYPDDPVLLYWKSLALAGSGDAVSARPILEKLLSSGIPVPGVSREQLLLASARIFRLSGKSEQAAEILKDIPEGSPFEDSMRLEKAADLIAAGKTAQASDLLRERAFADKEAKAAADYLAALAIWRAGDVATAAKMFEAVPPATPWIASASALGGAYCLSMSSREAKAAGLLQRHLESGDDPPFIEKEFRLLDRLSDQGKAGTAPPFSKWAQNRKHPVRAKFAAFFDARRRQREDARGGDPLLKSFVDAWPEDSLSDEARLLLAVSALRQGKISEASGLAADRPSVSAGIRSRYAYVRGLAAASRGDQSAAVAEFEKAGKLDPRLAQEALFNQAVLAATSARGRLELSEQARQIASLDDGLPSEEMRFQIALDLARRDSPEGTKLLAQVADSASDPGIKASARLASAELAMKSGQGTAAADDFAKVLKENAGEPERQAYLSVFLKDTGRKSDASAVVAAARDFLKAYPDSKFAPEVRLKLAEALLASGDLQGARIQFEQLASTGTGTEFGRRALFLAAQSAARSMDPVSIDDALVLLERVAGNGPEDILTWQARLQEGAIKNAQGLPKDALAIYDKILSSQVPDPEIRAAALMAQGDTLHRLADEDPARDREAVESWKKLSSDTSLSLRWRNEALCKQGMILEKLGDGDGALASYYEAFKNPRDRESEQIWHDRAAFEAARLLEERKQWNDASALYRLIDSEGGARAEEARARFSRLKLENFLWEN